MSALVLALSAIVGRSPYNVRLDAAPSDVASMMASIAAVGLLQPVIVRDDGRGYEALDGGRRLAALRALAEQGRVSPAHPVACLLDTRPEAEAREASLAANVVRRALHPVEEFEAFAQLHRVDALAVDRIAADFDVTTRYVRQRLALERLSPAVREAWRAGELTADAAEAFTAAPDHAAQDALLASPSTRYWVASNANAIRHHFTADAVRASAPEAIYVGLDAYAAAGGRIDDNLFEDWSLCRDGALLKRLCNEKLLRAGEALAERHGFGFAALRSEAVEAWKWTRLPTRRTAAEEARLDAIEEEEAEAVDEDGNMPEAVATRLNTERQDIETRAILRGATAAQRATAGVLVALNRDGSISADLGLVPPAKDATPRHANPAVASLRHAPEDPEGAPQPPTAPEEKKPGTALMTIVDAARTAAFAALVAERPYLAILLATVALRSKPGSPLRIEVACRNAEAPEMILGGFAAGAAAVLTGSIDSHTLLGQFAAAVAGTIVVRPEKTFGHTTFNGLADPDDRVALDCLIASYSGDAYEAALRTALDYPAYFKAATREAAIVVVEALDGDTAHARTLKKPELIAFAAELARDKGWLPHELRRPAGATPLSIDAPAATPTLADAMADALAADGETAEAAAPPSLYTVAEFLSGECELKPGARVKVATLFDTYAERAGARPREALSIQAFGTVLAEFGLEKTRLSAGVHVLGVALLDLAREAA